MLRDRPRLGTPLGGDPPRLHRVGGWPEVNARHTRNPPLGITPVVHPQRVAGPFQGLVGRGRQAFARGVQPRPGFESLGLPGTAQLGGGRVVALEPLLRRALNPIVAPLADEQVTVRVGPPADVDRQAIGQLLGGGQLPRKADRQLPLFSGAQRGRQGKFQPLEQPSIGPLVQVGRVPIGQRIGLGPPRHMTRFAVEHIVRPVALALPTVLVGPLDVGGRGPRGLAL